MDIGLLAPQAVELEEGVIGAVMVDREGLSQVIEILSPQSFYKDSHSRIYSAALTLHKRNEPVDILTITQELKKTNELEIIGGAWYITQLTNRISSAANIEFHARIVAQKYIQREIIRISTLAINSAYQEGADVFDLLDELKSNLTKIEGGIQTNKIEKTRDIVDKTLVAINDAKNNNGVLGLSTGLKVLDEILRGIRLTNVYVIAGRPAMGKSAIMNCIAKALCIQQNAPIAIFSLEMSSEQLILRLLSDLANIDNNILASGILTHADRDRLNEAQLKIQNSFNIDDTPAITIQYFESKIRKLVEQGVQYAIIDYLQLMTLSEKDRKGKNKEQEISFLTQNIKRIAKKYKIAIFELSQLSRECEKRVDKDGKVCPRPMLSDLRESGSIEQDADVVIFLYRPEYYNIDFVGKGKSTKGLAELIIAKHRGGAVDSVLVKYVGNLTRFEDIDHTQQTNSIDEQIPVHF